MVMVTQVRDELEAEKGGVVTTRIDPADGGGNAAGLDETERRRRREARRRSEERSQRCILFLLCFLLFFFVCECVSVYMLCELLFQCRLI